MFHVCVCVACVRSCARDQEKTLVPRFLGPNLGPGAGARPPRIQEQIHRSMAWKWAQKGAPGWVPGVGPGRVPGGSPGHPPHPQILLSRLRGLMDSYRRFGGEPNREIVLNSCLCLRCVRACEAVRGTKGGPWFPDFWVPTLARGRRLGCVNTA